MAVSPNPEAFFAVPGERDLYITADIGVFLAPPCRIQREDSPVGLDNRSASAYVYGAAWTSTTVIAMPELLILPILLILFSVALGDMPYDYYILLRWITSPLLAYLSVTAFRRKKEAWVWLWAIIAGIYNPILRVHLHKSAWRGVNIATILIILIAAWLGYKGKKTRERQ